jgi:hypothetical protein
MHDVLVSVAYNQLHLIGWRTSRHYPRHHRIDGRDGTR